MEYSSISAFKDVCFLLTELSISEYISTVPLLLHKITLSCNYVSDGPGVDLPPVLALVSMGVPKVIIWLEWR